MRKVALSCKDADGKNAWRRPAAANDLSQVYANGCEVRVRDGGFFIYAAPAR